MMSFRIISFIITKNWLFNEKNNEKICKLIQKYQNNVASQDVKVYNVKQVCSITYVML
jgi:hypothetical protein